MFTLNTESGIVVDYQSGDGTIDLNVLDPTITLTGDVTGSATMTNLGSVSIATTRTSGSTTASDLASVVTLLIKNSAGTTVKTLYGAGA